MDHGQQIHGMPKGVHIPPLHGSPDHVLHAAANFANMPKYSWNVFRYVGDYMHLAGILILLALIAKNKSVAGISRKTQILYFVTFVTRYLDLFDHSQTAYLVFFKLTYIMTSAIVLTLFYQLHTSYERRHDTVNLTVILIPCTVAALLLTNEYSLMEVLWTFSEFAEGFAMVPQYVFCYREKVAKDWMNNLYVISLGGYRVFYALNWIYKKIQMPHYSDIQSWLGGFIEIIFFIDFLNYRFNSKSFLRDMVLTVDGKINEISDKVELKVLGSSSAERFQTDGGEMRRRRKVEDERPMEDV